MKEQSPITTKKTNHKTVSKIKEDITVNKIYYDIRDLIEEARISVAIRVNVGMTLLYWQIGKRINDEILKGKRAEYGKQILATLSQQLNWSHFKEMLTEQNFFLTCLINSYKLYIAHPPSLCFACSILAGFSFSLWRLA